MKKFNEGAWFNLHKMTEEQQQWCMDNLKWLSEKGKDLCYQDKNLVPRYFSVNKGYFGGIWLHNADPSKELTFEDLYYEKEETKPMNLEKYSIEDLRRIRDNINGLLEVVDEINNHQDVQESEESLRGFEGLEFTELGKDIFLQGKKQEDCFAIKRHHTREQLAYINEYFPCIYLVSFRSVRLPGRQKVHFNDLFQYKTEEKCYGKNF